MLRKTGTAEVASVKAAENFRTPVNWYANKSGNEVTFPIGLNVSKVVWIGILPVKFQVQGQYMPVHPDVFGQKWNLQFALTPVIPKLIEGNIFGD